MRFPVLSTLLAFLGLGTVRDRYVNRPPITRIPTAAPALAPLVFITGASKGGWTGSPPANQRKRRKNARRAHAAGKRNAFR